MQNFNRLDLETFRDPDYAEAIASGIPSSRHEANMTVTDFFRLIYVLMYFYKSKNLFPKDILFIPHGSEEYIERYRSEYKESHPQGKDPRIITFDIARHEPASEPFLSGNRSRLKPHEGPDAAIYDYVYEGQNVRLKEFMLTKDNLALFSFFAKGNIMNVMNLIKLFEYFMFYNMSYFNKMGIINYSNLGIASREASTSISLLNQSGYYRKTINFWFRTEDKFPKLADPIHLESVLEIYGASSIYEEDKDPGIIFNIDINEENIKTNYEE